MSSAGPNNDNPAATLATVSWPAIISLSLGVFGLVTSEFLPASLLTPMAQDLGTTAGMAGQSVTATAFIAALAGPGVVVGTGRFDRRTVLLALTMCLPSAAAVQSPSV